MEIQRGTAEWLLREQVITAGMMASTELRDAMANEKRPKVHKARQTENAKQSQTG
jgi:hypothetical protein